MVAFHLTGAKVKEPNERDGKVKADSVPPLDADERASREYVAGLLEQMTTPVIRASLQLTDEAQWSAFVQHVQRSIAVLRADDAGRS